MGFFQGLMQGQHDNLINQGLDTQNQQAMANLEQMRTNMDIQAQIRAKGMAMNQEAQTNPAPPAVTLANLSQVPDAGLESLGKTAYGEQPAGAYGSSPVTPASAKSPTTSEQLATSAARMRAMGAQYQSLDPKIALDYYKASDKTLSDMHAAQAEERKSQYEQLDHAAGQLGAIKTPSDFSRWWDSGDMNSKQVAAPYLTFQMGRPIYDDAAKEFLSSQADQALSHSEQLKIGVKQSLAEAANARADAAAARADEFTRHNTAMEGIGRDGLKIRSMAGQSAASAVAPENASLHGAEYLSTLPPGVQNVVSKVADYTLDPKLLPARQGERGAILANAIQVDPKFDASEYPNRYALKKDFTSGKTSENIVSLDQAMNHMGTLKDLTAAIGNNDTQAINRLTSFVSNQLGDPKINNAQLATQAVGNELMRVFRQVNASEAETKQFEQRLNAAVNSPAQMTGALDVGAKLLEGRFSAVNQKWNKGMKTDTGYPDLLSPEAKGAYEKLTGKPYSGGGSGAASAGQFQEGQVYQDGSGNKAKYVKGQWVPQ